MKIRCPLKYLIVIPFIIYSTTCKKLDINELTKIKTGAISNLGLNSATITSSFIDVGENVSEYGHCWGKNTNPTINDEKDMKGSTPPKGDFSSDLNNLEANTIYYARPYAIEGDVTLYGEQKSFNTLASIPTVTINPITDITENSANTGGDVIDVGGEIVIARGVCWSTKQNPTVSDLISIDGSGSGTYISSLTGLTQGETYYVRAYATNSEGTGYSDEKSFTTEILVNIPDANFEQAVRNTIGKPTGDIYASDVNQLTSFEAKEKNIASIEGIQYFTNIEWLTLDKNQISNISPISGLTNLTNISFAFNQISDISALAGLTKLSGIGFWDNQISDISALSGLTNLTWLDLPGNQIANISVISGLTKLNFIHLFDNQISDISSLSGLTNLTELWMGENQIADISPLAGLTNLTNLQIQDNQFSDISSLSGLVNLTELSLSRNEISSVSSLSGLTNLVKLWIDNNQISEISSFSGLVKLTNLDLGANQVSEISSLSGLTNLTWLSLWWNQISDISSLSGLTNLTNLEIGNNDLISDISSLTGLTKLTRLRIASNKVSDISYLSELTNLTDLMLDGNQIVDISALSGLTNLKYLDLNWNQIIDINPLILNSGMDNGDDLFLTGNPLSTTSTNVYIPQLQDRGVNVQFGKKK